MTTPETPPPGRAQRGNRFALPNGAYRGLLAAMGAIFVGLVAWFIISMIVQARPAFSTLGFSWIIQKTWDPTHNKYGLLPFILGTLETTAIAMVFAVPIGLGTALALAYLVPHRLRQGLSTAVELLAAVPSVVYGLWGLIVLAPLFREYVEPFLTSVFGWTGLFNGPNEGVGLLLAGIILFVMVLPTMVAISRDVLAVVPSEQVEGAMALGATRWQVLLQGGRARCPYRHPRRVHPGHRPCPRRDGGGGPGHRQLALYRPLGQIDGINPSGPDRQQFRRGHRYRAQRPVRRRPGPVVDRRDRQCRGPRAGPLRGPVRCRVGGSGMTTLNFDASTDPILERRRAIQDAAATSLGRRKIPRRSPSGSAGPSWPSPSFRWWR